MLIRWLRRLLGFNELEARIRDLERHFVTKRDPATGAVTQTLADVPLDQRKEIVNPTRGMSVQQRRQWLEKTDGGRAV
jgi:hypothetical protein